MPGSKVLLIDDNCEALKEGLKMALEGCELLCAPDGSKGLDELSGTADIECVLLDLRMPAQFGSVSAREGLDVLRRIKERHAYLPVVMLTVEDDVDTVVEVMKAGAFHYVTKPPDPAKLVAVVERAVQECRRYASLREKVAIRDEILAEGGVALEEDRFGSLVGRSEAMRRVYSIIAKVCDKPIPVLITGEPGTGKELVARELHRRGKGPDKPFRAVNCANLVGELLGSELFGHRKGAFTGASADRKGEFELADGGTLFLDEIGDMKPEFQARLLRVLDSGEVKPLGAETKKHVDVRLICATNRDIDGMVSEGAFRQDLFDRISGIRISMPPLRERKEDIPLLVRCFLDTLGPAYGKESVKVSQTAIAKLEAAEWRGNVRELRNFVESQLALLEGDELSVPQMPAATPDAHPAMQVLRDIQRRINCGDRNWKDILGFRDRFGELVLRESIRWAVKKTKDLRGAAKLLGFMSTGSKAEYDNFRSWMAKLGLSKRAILSE